MGRLADREDDVLRQLREEQDVGDVGVECVLEQRGRLTGGEQDDRCLRVLADRGELVGRQLGAAGCVQHGAEVAAGERAGALRYGLAVARRDRSRDAARASREAPEGPRTNR